VRLERSTELGLDGPLRGTARLSPLRRRQLLALRLRGRHFALHMRRTLLPLRLCRGGRRERQGGEQKGCERRAASAAHAAAG
jgi:hypothetical protein